MKFRPVLMAVFPLLLLANGGAGQENPFRMDWHLPPTELVMGRNAKIEVPSGTLKGELLGVSGDSLWLIAQGATLGVPLREVSQLDVQVNKWGRSRVLTWNLVAGLGSALALTAACSSVEDVSGGCGSVFVGWTLTWGLIGGIAGAFLASKSHKEIYPSSDALRPFVRYPQGVPDAVKSGLRPGRPGG